MKFMVTGAGGLLGTTVVGAARGRGHEVLPLDRAQLDVTRLEEVRRHVARGRPDWIVHCAAYTHVDRAESEPDRAYTINRDGARIVAEAAREVGAGILYVSTDFVFAGDRRMPYRPSDPVGPLGVYGRSKLAGEQAVQAAGGLWLIARTGWLYGSSGGNFVDTMLARALDGANELTVVADQTGGPTWTESLAPTLVELAERGTAGLFHVADRGEATWYELAREAFRLAGVDTRVEPVSAREWAAPAPRPAYSVLSVSDAERIVGREFPEWRASLARHVAEVS